ncbi:uncharacterized protein [Hetaerina americana]|uniref:uncharacterized protein n=1 Tax=Hetaerina americana TaxID=62018 RepID=UPI003A7F4601
MAEDKLLSMSLDDIIRLNRASGKAGSSRSSSQTRSNIGTRGRGNFSTYRRRGRIGVATNRNLRNGGVKADVPYRNSRGTFRRRGYYVGQRNVPLRIQDRILQRQQNIALARSRLQMAKRFLNNRQRLRVIGSRNMGVVSHLQYRRTLVRGARRGMRRGTGGFRMPSNLILNSFRSNQLARINTYRNKVNRTQSAVLRNQVQAAPSLIVSIENDRAGSSSASSGLRGGRRGMRRRGNLSRVNTPIQMTNNIYRQTTATPFHTGALNPAIQKMIADIQGKSIPASERVTGRFSQRGATRGFGMVRGSLGLGRGHIVARQQSNQAIDGLQMGHPMATSCTLNERFGGRK